MANVSISGLPEQTGKTDNDVLVIVDSGETTTSKIKVSTLLSGSGGSTLIVDGTGTESIKTDSTGNVAANDYSVVLGGQGNEINGPSTNFGGNGLIAGENNTINEQNDFCVIAGGKSNTILNSNAYDYNFIGGGNNNNCGGSRAFNIGGINNSVVGDYSGNLGGQSNSWNHWDTNVIIACDNGVVNNPSSNGVIVGGKTNTIGHNNSVVIGGDTLSTSFDNEVVLEHLTINGQSTEKVQNAGQGGAITIDFDEGNMVEFSMSADTSLTLTNIKEGGRYSFKVNNLGTHSITGVTASGFTILCEGGSIPNITNNGVDLCVLEIFGTNIMVRHFSDFSTP